MTALVCPYPCVTAQDPGEEAREPAPWGTAQGAGLISGSCDTFHASVLFSFQTLNLKKSQLPSCARLPQSPSLQIQPSTASRADPEGAGATGWMASPLGGLLRPIWTRSAFLVVSMWCTALGTCHSLATPTLVARVRPSICWRLDIPAAAVVTATHTAWNVHNSW